MLRRRTVDRVNDKITKLRKQQGMKSNMPTQGKGMPPRTHKSHIPAMRQRPEFEMPEDVCKRLGHKEFTLAQGPNLKIVYCLRLCGYYKAYRKHS